MKKLLPCKSFAKDTISHCGDSIEGKLMTAVDELIGVACGNATEETEKDVMVEKYMLMKIICVGIVWGSTTLVKKNARSYKESH
jgi:hypothetical protein